MFRKTSMMLTFLVLAPFPIPGATDWNGVCVGINDYPGSYDDLSYCVADAVDLKDALINNQEWSSSKIKLLTDSNASETDIMNEIQAMPRSSGYTDWFPFSGHGDSEELGGNDGVIPANSLSARITQSELQSWFGMSYNQYCSFLDACGSGIFPRDMTKGVISSASEPDEYASESGSIGHGYFSYYLIQGLTNSAADGSDGGDIVSAEELHLYAAPRTTNDSPYQHPQLKDNYAWYNLDLGPLAAPSDLTATVVPHTKADLSWTDNSDNEYGFFVLRSDNGSSIYYPIDQVGANVTAYQDNTLSWGNYYMFRVQSWRGALFSSYSNTALLPLHNWIIGPTYLDVNETGTWYARYIGGVGSWNHATDTSASLLGQSKGKTCLPFTVVNWGMV